jgi:hypothetical protein
MDEKPESGSRFDPERTQGKVCICVRVVLSTYFSPRKISTIELPQPILEAGVLRGARGDPTRGGGARTDDGGGCLTVDLAPLATAP